MARTVYAALSLFDFSLIDAARTLGCSYPSALLKVMVPALGPAFLTSGMFAFLASMDNYPISIFFTDAWTKTLPIQMLQYVEETPDPTIAAISAGLVLLAILGAQIVGLAVQAAGVAWIEKLMPPVVTGSVVAVIGLGPIGQMCARIAHHRGARVFGVDLVPERLERDAVHHFRTERIDQ